MSWAIVMVVGRLKYVHRIVDRYGNARFYLRVNGQEHRLTGAVGSPEFLKKYNTLIALHYSGKLAPRPRQKVGRCIQTNCNGLRSPHPGSVEWVIVEYLKSQQYADLAVSTRRLYRAAFDVLRSILGRRILVRLDMDDVDEYCARIARERGSATADLHLRLISTLWKFSKGLPECRRNGRSNPTNDADKHYKVRTPHEPWPMSVQRRFLDVASPSLRLAFYLLLFTGQRRGDVVAMKWRDLDGNKIKVVQSKTSETVFVHIHKKLREALDAASREHENILTNRLGRPFTPGSLTNAFARTLIAIGARGYSVHGLRKTAAVALAEAGRSELEIMAVLGHRTSKMAIHYCRAANKTLLNENAIKAWETIL
jgi:integrase